MLVTNILSVVVVIVLTISGRNGMPLLQNQIETLSIMRIDPESRLSVGDIIENSGYFPVQINVPDTIMSLFQGAQVAVNNVAQQVPFLKPFTRPDEPRPLVNILLPIKIANRGTFVIPLFKQDDGLMDIPFDFNKHVNHNGNNAGYYNRYISYL